MSPSRLPVVGSDNDQWGQILNEFLSVEHDSDGTHSHFSKQVRLDSRYGTIVTNSDASTVTFNVGASDKHALTLGGNRTLAVTGDQVGQSFTIILTQDATGSRAVTWWSGIRWPGGAVPVLTTAAGKADVFIFMKIAEGSYLGFPAGLNL